ncbi:class I SAM-dependent methyltransferase [Methanosarcina sp. T3]|uniref:class I SAM-dependent methyltransferase n=1 Tax=Methanosarcina sp. T3 TaxID=3439062 RepID=UPI003F851304
MSKPKSVWEEFFEGKRSGGHRSSAEEFISREAREKLFHLDGGKTLLDFGCGAGELLVYYAQEYERLVGADFSSSMLDEASKRIRARRCENIALILADDKTVWEKLDSSFDRITAAGVIQYLTDEEVDTFISHASGHLKKGGKIIFFDLLDPRLYPLWKIGFFSRNFGCRKIFYKIGFEALTVVSASLKNRPRDILGYTHKPCTMESIANKHGFKMEYVQSMYYEYKYHAIMSLE